MRTVKASEVRKGMTVQVMTDAKGVERMIRGEVREVDTVTESTWITFVDNRSEEMHANHPVTVLAEPEPEWVEGAWYWTQTKHAAGPTLRMRSDGFWRSAGHTTNEYHLVTKDLTVLGRVLIVDWPGDDVARDLVESYSDNRDDFTLPANQMAVKVADAIRTQGGVR